MPDADREAQAVVSVVGQSLGFSYFPLPDDDYRPPLLDLEVAVDAVAGGESIGAPAKLHLLSHASRSDLPRAELQPIAESLLIPPGEQEQDPSDLVEALMDRVYASGLGEDPLLGDRFGPFTREELLRALVPELQETSLRVSPSCVASSMVIDGYLALSLTTTVTSFKPFTEVRSMADPTFWPRCPPQSAFFKSMTMVEPTTPPPRALIGPDVGWRARLKEVVDFSYGFNPSGSSKMTTDLDFVYFDQPTAAGCTYDLHASVQDKILVDRGYVLVEDLRGPDLRRTTSLKQVCFKYRPQPGGVCRLWSLAHGMVSSSCIVTPISDPGSAP